MANTVLNVAHKFPTGTSVAAHVLKGVEQRILAGTAPQDSTAAETEAVAADGTLTYTTLTAAESYAAYASVSGENRYVRFQAT